jgi:hypothetical protein
LETSGSAGEADVLVEVVHEASARGESKPLDLENILRRGRERMAAEGIVD